MAETAVSFVRALRESLPGLHEWTERDAAVLALAERQAADIDRLEVDIAELGVRVEGRGATVLNQAFARSVTPGWRSAGCWVSWRSPASLRPGSQHARKAAQARWKGAA